MENLGRGNSADEHAALNSNWHQLLPLLLVNPGIQGLQVRLSDLLELLGISEGLSALYHAGSSLTGRNAAKNISTFITFNPKSCKHLLPNCHKKKTSSILDSRVGYLVVHQNVPLTSLVVICLLTRFVGSN